MICYSPAKSDGPLNDNPGAALASTAAHRERP